MAWEDGCFCAVWHRNCPIITIVLILALDTSSPAGSLAVLRDEKVIGTVSSSTDEIYSSRMFRHLEFLLGELSLGLREFDLFAIAAGPGSFTGLRVGLAAVKGWAEVYRKPIAAVNALEAVAVQAHSDAGLIVPVLDARRGQLYFGLYRRATGGAGDIRLVLDGAEYVMTPPEFFEALSKRAGGAEFAIVTPQPELFSALAPQNEIANLKAVVQPASSVLAPFIGQLGFRQAQRGAL